MVEKVVSASAGMSTIVVGGDVVKVTFEGHPVNYVFIRHVSGEVLVSRSPNVADGVDGTVKLSAGGYRFDVSAPVIYISGSGVCEVSASALGDFPFKVSGKGGEIPDLSVYAKTADIQNENLLINPDFKINQRGSIDFSVDYHAGSPISQSQKYTVDRWRIMEGRANISNGKFVLTGTIIQVLENSIGSDFTASVSIESGTATANYDDSTKTFSIVGNNAVLNWAKLEYGSNATQFSPPDTATELLKCERFFRTFDSGFVLNTIGSFHYNGNNQFVYIFDTPMRVAPNLIFTDCGVRRVSEPYVDVSVTSFNSLSTKRTLHIYCQMDTLYDDAIFILKSDNGLAADAEIY